MPLTQEDIPRIIQEVVKSLADINSQGESTTSHRTPTSTAPATTMTTHSTSNFTPYSDGATTRCKEARKGPQCKNCTERNIDGIEPLTEGIFRIVQGVIQYLAEATVILPMIQTETKGQVQSYPMARTPLILAKSKVKLPPAQLGCIPLPERLCHVAVVSRSIALPGLTTNP